MKQLITLFTAVTFLTACSSSSTPAPDYRGVYSIHHSMDWGGKTPVITTTGSMTFVGGTKPDRLLINNYDEIQLQGSDFQFVTPSDDYKQTKGSGHFSGTGIDYQQVVTYPSLNSAVTITVTGNRQ